MTSLISSIQPQVLESKICIFFQSQKTKKNSLRLFRVFLYLLTLFLIFLPNFLFSQDETEAPESIFSSKIGDADVDFHLVGSWTTRIAFGWGLAVPTQGSSYTSAYPDMDQGFNFQQIPNLDASIWLMKRYYLEASYQGDSNGTFILGYKGQNPEPLEWAKIGNGSIEVEKRASLDMPAGQKGSPALAFSFDTGFSNHQFLARLQDSSTVTKTFTGTRESVEETLELDAWVRGRFFQLPSTNLTSVTVLIQDKDGSITVPSSSIPSTDTGWTRALENIHFRKATSAEAYIDLVKGTIELPSATQKTLLVTWNSAPSSYTDTLPASPITFTANSALSGQTGNFFVLFRAGAYNPFEEKNHYTLPTAASGTPTFALLQRNTTDKKSGYTFTWVSGEDTFKVSGSQNPPFKNLTSLSGAIYDPAYVATGSNLDYIIDIKFLPSSAPEKIQLGTDVLAGSLTVTRNGVGITTFTYDSKTGTLDLHVPVFDTDTIIVTYQKIKDYNSFKDLLLYQGNQFRLTPDQTLDVAESFQWNVASGRYTTEESESPGKISLAVEWKGRTETTTWALKSLSAAVLTDSTGYRQLDGMNAEGYQVALSSSTLRPSAAPGTIGSYSLTQLNRAPVYYKNYWSTDNLTGSQYLASGTKSGVSQESYSSGGYTGPYMIYGDGDLTDERLFVVESTFSSSDIWAGAQALFSPGSSLNLSGVESIRMRVRLSSLPANAKLYLQVGTMSEDIDGTGSPASTSSNTLSGMSFYDQNKGYDLTYPFSETSSWTTDANSDGVLSPDGTLATFDLTSSTETDITQSIDTSLSSWQTVRISLTAAQRKILATCTGWRLVVVSGGVTGKVKVISESPTFEGTSFAPDASSDTVTLREIPETQTSLAAKTVLSSQFSEVSKIFNSSESDQSVLEIHSTGSYSLRNNVSTFRYKVWKKIIFYYRLASGSLDPISISFQDSDSEGLTASWTPAVSSTWQKVVIDLQKKTIQIDDSTPKNASVSLDSSSKNWTKIIIAATGSASAYAYFDEIHGENPQWELQQTVTAQSTWSQKEAFPSQAVPLVAGTTLSSRTDTTVTTTKDDTVSTVSNLHTVLLGSTWNAEFSGLKDNDEATLHGAYDTSIPVGPLTFTERFSDLGFRKEGVSLNLPGLGTLSTTAQASGPPIDLEQNYTASWDRILNPYWESGLATKFSYKQIYDDSITLESFGTQWKQSMDWLRLRSDPGNYTQIRNDSSWTMGGTPLASNMNFSYFVTQTKGDPWYYGPEGLWNISLPIVIGGEGSDWKIIPSTGRTLIILDASDSGLETSNLINQSWKRFESVSDGLFQIPYSEIFRSHVFSGQPDTIYKASLESRSGISFERPRTLDWRDLALPLNVDINHLNRQSRNSGSLLNYWNLQVLASSQTLNQFGRHSNAKIFNWYDDDEFTWAIQSTVSDGSNDSDKLVNISFQNTPKIFINQQENISLESKVIHQYTTTENTNSLEVLPAWEIVVPANLPFELPRWLSPSKYPRLITHKIGLDVYSVWGEEDAPVLQKLEVDYSSTLKISDGGSIKLSFEWGNRWSETLYVIGMEIALDVKLSF